MTTLRQTATEASSDTTIAGWDWVIAAVIVICAIVLARVLQVLVVRFLRHGQKSATFSEVLVGRFVAAIITLIGLVYALSVLGVQIGPLLGALGIGGVAVALALQPTLQNLFAGVVLEAQRPFRRGEEIETNGLTGVVVDVTSRATVIVTLDGQRVYLPNTEVLENPILNRVREHRRRSTLTVGVAYGTPLADARQVISSVISGVDEVFEDPEPRVFARQFGDSSIDFEVDIWHRADDISRRAAVDATVMAIDLAFAEHNITIPFPQRTVWLPESAPADDSSEQPSA